MHGWGPAARWRDAAPRRASALARHAHVWTGRGRRMRRRAPPASHGKVSPPATTASARATNTPARSPHVPGGGGWTRPSVSSRSGDDPRRRRVALEVYEGASPASRGGSVPGTPARSSACWTRGQSWPRHRQFLRSTRRTAGRRGPRERLERTAPGPCRGGGAPLARRRGTSGDRLAPQAREELGAGAAHSGGAGPHPRTTSRDRKRTPRSCIEDSPDDGGTTRRAGSPEGRHAPELQVPSPTPLRPAGPAGEAPRNRSGTAAEDHTGRPHLAEILNERGLRTRTGGLFYRRACRLHLCRSRGFPAMTRSPPGRPGPTGEEIRTRTGISEGACGGYAAGAWSGDRWRRKQLAG